MNKYAFGVILSNQPTKKAIAAQMVKEQVQIKIVVAYIQTTLAADKGETVTPLNSGILAARKIAEALGRS